MFEKANLDMLFDDVSRLEIEVALGADISEYGNIEGRKTGSGVVGFTPRWFLAARLQMLGQPGIKVPLSEIVFDEIAAWNEDGRTLVRIPFTQDRSVTIAPSDPSTFVSACERYSPAPIDLDIDEEQLQDTSSFSPIDILKKRFAAGEIDEDEFERKKELVTD